MNRGRQGVKRQRKGLSRLRDGPKSLRGVEQSEHFAPRLLVIPIGLALASRGFPCRAASDGPESRGGHGIANFGSIAEL